MGNQEIKQLSKLSRPDCGRGRGSSYALDEIGASGQKGP
jgi:hypothetical protein